MMKKEYLEIGFFFLFTYICWRQQFAMARHAHRRRIKNFNECYHCPPGYGAERHCNRHHDTVCVECATDHYSEHYSPLKPCYPCSRCGTGLYVAHKCTASKDTVCDSCHTYKGPHNENFYEKCVKPLLDSSEQQKNVSRSDSNQSDSTKDTHSIIAVDLSRDIPTFIAVASAVAIAALGVILLVTCIVVSRSRCKRVDQRYPYQAVATKEAVML